MVSPNQETWGKPAVLGEDLPSVGIPTPKAGRVQSHRSEGGFSHAAEKRQSTQACGPCGQVFWDV